MNKTPQLVMHLMSPTAGHQVSAMTVHWAMGPPTRRCESTYAPSPCSLIRYLDKIGAPTSTEKVRPNIGSPTGPVFKQKAMRSACSLHIASTKTHLVPDRPRG